LGQKAKYSLRAEHFRVALNNGHCSIGLMTYDHESITVRVTFAGGCPDDYQVFWRSVPIGRIMKTTGYPTRDAQWSWVISLPRESGDCGTGDNLADCEAKLGRALARILARVTKDDRAPRG
jgi:hypothetical protein